MSSPIDIFVAYQFLRILSTPWEKTDAFKLGIIDKNGKILKKRRKLKTQEEKKAYTIFHTLVWNVKRLLDILPPTRARIGSFAAALWMLKQHTERQHKNLDFRVVTAIFEQHLKETIGEQQYRQNMLQHLAEQDQADSNILSAGTYILLHDVDTNIGPVKVGDRIRVTRNTRAFDTIAGEQVFKVVHHKLKAMIVVTKQDLAKEE